MKRKILSLILTTTILLTLFPLFGIVTASAADLENFTMVWANDVAAGKATPKISDSASNYRKMTDNATGAPDAYDYSDVKGKLDNQKISATRYYEHLSYYFGDQDEYLLPKPIYNNPDNEPFFDNKIDDVVSQMDVAGYDLCLFEATVGAWHPEAVEITLLGATVGGQIIDEYPIGVAFNNVGNMLMRVGCIDETQIGIDGFSQKNANTGNLSATFVWFPDDVESAEGVKLKDLTATYNAEPYEYNGKNDFKDGGIWYRASSFRASADGFDLDAIGAWAAGDPPINLRGEIQAVKFNDVNLNGVYDADEGPLAGFKFQLLKYNGTDYAAIPPLDANDDSNNDGISDKSFAESEPSGFILFDLWESGLYKIIEIPEDGWVQTTNLDGVYVKVEGIITTYGAESGSYTSEDVFAFPFGNVEYIPIWANNAGTGAAIGGISDSGSNYRINIGNSLDEPDAYTYTDVNAMPDNQMISALRYHEYVVFEFGDQGDSAKTIYNNPDIVPVFNSPIDNLISTVDVAGYDLCLFEATVGAWHPEAVEITLRGVTTSDGTYYDEYPIGVAFNNVGNMLVDLGLITNNVTTQVNAKTGNLSATFVWFPDEVVSATSVKLKDVTAEYNETPYELDGSTDIRHNGMRYDGSSYTDSKDGFDLDAIGVWTTKVSF